jgi:putative hemolysin
MSVWKFFQNLFLKTKQENSTTSSDKQEINTNEDVSVYDCMIPSKNLYFVHIQTPYEELLENICEKNISHIFVYDQNSDDLVGIVNQYDIINTIYRKEKKDGCDFLFSNIHYVSYMTSIQNALHSLYEKNTNVLIVVDNRGSTLGVFTKEALVDFVHGYEQTLKLFENTHKNKNSIIVKGDLLLRHIPIDWHIPEFQKCYKNGTRTIGGFLGYHSGIILKVNNEITINHLSFTIIEATEKVIYKILIKKLTSPVLIS